MVGDLQRKSVVAKAWWAEKANNRGRNVLVCGWRTIHKVERIVGLDVIIVVIGVVWRSIA